MPCTAIPGACANRSSTHFRFFPGSAAPNSAALAASRAQDQGLFLFDADCPRRDRGPEVESHAPADPSAELWQQAVTPVPHPPASRNPRFSFCSSGWLLLRYDERAFLRLLLKEPPRHTYDRAPIYSVPALLSGWKKLPAGACPRAPHVAFGMRVKVKREKNQVIPPASRNPRLRYCSSGRKLTRHDERASLRPSRKEPPRHTYVPLPLDHSDDVHSNTFPIMS